MTSAHRWVLGLLAISAVSVIVVFLDIRADHQTAFGASRAAARQAFWVFWGGPLAVVGSTLWLVKHSVSYQLDGFTLWATSGVHVLGWGLLLSVDFILQNA